MITPREAIYGQKGIEVVPSVFKMPGPKATEKTTTYITKNFNLPIHVNNDIITLICEQKSQPLPYEFWHEKQKVLNAKWHVVSLDNNNKIHSWLDNNNNWTTDKQQAKIFPNQEEARERCNQICNTVGRGTYTIFYS